MLLNTATKTEPINKLNSLYQDYVCSCILRIAKEVFQLVPLNSLIINTQNSFLNSTTGHFNSKTIISVKIERGVIEGINYELLDPSDSMSNFEVHMNFDKVTGFAPVNELN